MSFTSVLNSSSTAGVLTVEQMVHCTVTSVVIGVVIALAYILCGRASKPFAIALVVLPVIIQAVIMMVNGNIGAGVAVMGAFSLVRFRSVPGSAKDITFIFLAMSAGLATGMGYVTFAISVAVVVCALIVVLSKLPAVSKREEKLLRVVMPEDLDYSGVFDDIFKEYTTSCTVERVKTTNLGSMFEVSYIIVLKDPKKEKELIDAIRCRNGNLTIICSRYMAPNDQL